MLTWVTRPSTAELTKEFCHRLDESANLLQGEFAVALTGGESAAVFYDAWAQHGVAERLRFYWSDERVVPPDNPDSNFKLAAEHLLRPGRVAESHLHPAPTQLPAGECASAYAEQIRHQVPGGPISTPQFPLIILGLGSDGHTGSLFPGRDPYAEDDALVRAVEGTPAHPHARITFTPKLINAARQVWLVVTGANKAWAVRQLAERRALVEKVPALVVNPNETRVTIFADAAAAGSAALGPDRATIGK
ncbi:MAG: 6-phosphogluconolactonase, partial [Terriglobales bacterium]